MILSECVYVCLWGNNIIKSQLVSLQIFIAVLLRAVLDPRETVMR